MEQYTLSTNDSDQYMPITAIKPQPMFFVKENSSFLDFREYNYDNINNLKATEAGGDSPATRQDLAGVVRNNFNTAFTPSDYIGAATMDVPTLVLDNFTDYHFYNLQAIPPSGLVSATIDSAMASLYDIADNNAKVISVTNGLQFLRIPSNVFNTIDLDGNVITKNYGTYYLKISPKFVTVPVTSINLRNRGSYADVIGGTLIPQRRSISFEKNNFYNTPWNFEGNNLQQGRLYGSVVEIWDTNNLIKKQTLISNEDSLSLDNASTSGLIVLEPETVGYDPVSQTITPGDNLRIYPRESYFNPILVQVSYADPALNLTSLVQFMKNDVVQDLITGVYEIYDSEGVISDGSGNINGTVVQAYQISKEGTVQIRRSIALTDSSHNPVSL